MDLRTAKLAASRDVIDQGGAAIWGGRSIQAAVRASARPIVGFVSHSSWAGANGAELDEAGGELSNIRSVQYVAQSYFV